MATETKVLDINGTKSLVKKIQDTSFSAKEGNCLEQTVNTSLNTERCNIEELWLNSSVVNVSKDGNKLVFADTKFDTGGSNQYHIVTLSNYNNRMVRVKGQLTFELPYIQEDEFSFHIWSTTSTTQSLGNEVYSIKNLNDNCTVDIDICFYIKYGIFIEMSSHNYYGDELPKIIGTLQILPYVPENNSTTYVQINTPENPNTNDLWAWDGSIKRYDGSKWIELLPIDDSVPIKISCSGGSEIPAYMYHVEHDDNTYIIKINYKFEEAFYHNSGAYLDITLDNLDVTKPLYLKVDIEKYGTTNESLGYIYGEDCDYNEIVCDSSESIKSGTLTISPNPLLVGGYISVGYIDFYDDTGYYYPDFRGYIKIWQD